MNESSLTVDSEERTKVENEGLHGALLNV